MIKEALFYACVEDKIHCRLCPHNCVLKEEGIGACGVRQVKRAENQSLKLYSLNYGEITSLGVDPIEKKPLVEFYPGTSILSIGSFGCNFKCSFCQNYSISQFKGESTFISPEELVGVMINAEKKVPNLLGIAFTYNEPSIWYEYVMDAVKLIKSQLPEHKVVLVSNGFINQEPLIQLLPYIDAMNIDLKGNDEFYKKMCNGGLKPVFETISTAHEKGVHVEVTTLLIREENTDEDTTELVGDFLSQLDPDIPLHISRYFPNYKLENPPTTIGEMKRVYELLKRKLNHVYVGNVSEDERRRITN